MRMPVLIPQSKYPVTAGVHIGNSENERNFDSVGMPCWYFDKQQLRDTPSIRDGMSFETERRYRKEGSRFIIACGTNMSLGHNTMATGVVYFHRFYMFHSFKSFPRYVTACCCLFLAGKVEETPKKCRDIIRTARALLEDNYFFSFGDDPKEEVMTLERILLQTIKFDLQVEHPYTFLVRYAKCFKGDQAKLQKMVQMAWNFVNDSLSTVVCLQWEPEIIAVALIHLASKLSKFTLVDWNGRQPHHARWWDMFVSEVTMEILEDICHQVLDLYQNNQKESNGPPSPPQLPPSRAEVPKPAPPSKIRQTSTSSGGHSPARKALKQTHPSSASSSNISSVVQLLTQSASTASAQHTQQHGVNNNNNNNNNSTNHIQPIRSLANSAAQVPLQQLDVALPSISSTASSSGGYHQAAHHQMYRPPSQPQQQPTNSTSISQPIHSIYGTPSLPPPSAVQTHNYGITANSNINSSHLQPLPPPPPIAAPYSANAWPQSLPTAPHYPSNLPPMPPPQSAPGSNSGYYHHQQQQQHHHPRHHSQHYARQQRY